MDYHPYSNSGGMSIPNDPAFQFTALDGAAKIKGSTPKSIPYPSTPSFYTP